MNIRHTETYRRPRGARYLVGSTLAPMCKRRYPEQVRGGCEKYENDRGSSLLTAKMREISENVSKPYKLMCKKNVLSSSRENQKRIRINTGKEVHGIRQWELQ